MLFECGSATISSTPGGCVVRSWQGPFIVFAGGNRGITLYGFCNFFPLWLNSALVLKLSGPGELWCRVSSYYYVYCGHVSGAGWLLHSGLCQPQKSCCIVIIRVITYRTGMELGSISVPLNLIFDLSGSGWHLADNFDKYLIISEAWTQSGLRGI